MLSSPYFTGLVIVSLLTATAYTFLPPSTNAAKLFELTPQLAHIPSTVLFPLPSIGFDPTEAAVPWKVLKNHNHRIVFATPDGQPSIGADPFLVNGLYGGMLLKAGREPLDFYQQMINSTEYKSPISYAQINPKDYDGMVFVGGHAPGMRDYLESETLRDKIRQFWSLQRPVGAICHGVLAVSRVTDDKTGKSIIHDYKTTSVPVYLERQFYWLTQYVGMLPAQEYQLSTTWPRYVEDEIRSEIGMQNFIPGPTDRMAALLPGNIENHEHTFLVEDRHYLSARFWGDAYAFSLRFSKLLTQKDEIVAK